MLVSSRNAPQREAWKRARQTFRTVEEAEHYAKQVRIEIRAEGDLALAIEVQAYTVGEVRRIMVAANASPDASRAVPVMAIGFFAGLRPSEVLGLDWKDVSLTAKRIRVSPETAKKRRARYVDMSDNLVEWLTPYARESGPVAPPLITYRRARAAIMKVAECPLIKDGFRHSFGTYHLAAYEDVTKTAFAMGHRSNNDLIFTNYRKLVTREEGQAFWKITPQKLISTDENKSVKMVAEE